MNKVKSKFSFIVYLNLTLVILLIILTVYGFLHPEIYSKVKSQDSKSLINLLILFLCFFAFYSFAKRTFLLTIENGTIYLKGIFFKSNIRSSEIKAVNLFSAENLYWSIGSRTIATSINLENGKKIVIADSFYRNISQLKTALVENFKDKTILPQNQFKSQTTGTELETDYEKIAGNSFTSFNGLMIIGLIIFIVLALTGGRPLTLGHLFLLFPLSIFYFGFGSQLHYFLISNKHLVVRNHCFPWINKIYNLEEIILVNFEKPGRRSKSLRITTIDFKSKLFSAGSLREKHWKILRVKLRSLGIQYLNVID